MAFLTASLSITSGQSPHRKCRQLFFFFVVVVVNRVQVKNLLSGSSSMKMVLLHSFVKDERVFLTFRSLIESEDFTLCFDCRRTLLKFDGD
jgi:hypothetical protein